MGVIRGQPLLQTSLLPGFWVQLHPSPLPLPLALARARTLALALSQSSSGPLQLVVALSGSSHHFVSQAPCQPALPLLLAQTLPIQRRKSLQRQLPLPEPLSQMMLVPRSPQLALWISTLAQPGQWQSLASGRSGASYEL